MNNQNKDKEIPTIKMSVEKYKKRESRQKPVRIFEGRYQLTKKLAKGSFG